MICWPGSKSSVLLPPSGAALIVTLFPAGVPVATLFHIRPVPLLFAYTSSEHEVVGKPLVSVMTTLGVDVPKPRSLVVGL